MNSRSQIGVGIVGSGMIAQFHATALQQIEGVRLVGIYSSTEGKRQSFADKWSCRAFATLQELLSEVDMILIATPSGTHLDITLEAAKQDVHVLCEKPLEITTSRIDQMIEAAEENQIILGGIFNRRFNSAVSRLKEAVVQNRFGQLTICDAQIKWYRTQEYYDSGGWRGTWTLDGGGALMNQSIHTIDLLIYLAGPIKRLAAITKTLTHDRIEVEDNAVIMVEYESGAIGTIQASTSCWSEDGHAAEVNICGTAGSVFMHDDRFAKWEFKEAKPEDETIRTELMRTDAVAEGANDPKAIQVDGHIRNIQNFVLAVRGTDALGIDGLDARKAVAVIEAIYESARNDGKWITL